MFPQPSNEIILLYGFTFLVILWFASFFRGIQRLREIDYLSPRIFWGGAYILSSFGLPIIRYWIDNPLVIVSFPENILPDYVFLVILGYLGFLFGTYLANRNQLKFLNRNQNPDIQLGIQLSRTEFIGNAVMFLIVFVMLLSYGNIIPERLSSSGGTIYGQNQLLGSGQSYYLETLSRLIFLPALVLSITSTQKRIGRILTLPIVFFIFIYFIINFFQADRSSIFNIALVFLFLLNSTTHKIRFREILIFAVVLLLFFYIVSTWRQTWSWQNLTQIVSYEISVKQLVTGFLNDVGAPGFITMNLIVWFPSVYNYFWGRTYIDAIFNLIPGFFFGGSFNRPFLQPTILFKELLEGYSLNPNIGYGFSLLGEAFINFGIWGIFIIFCIVGFSLQYFYLRAQKQQDNDGWFLSQYIVFSIPFIFGLRSSALELFKIIFYGMMMITLVRWFVRPRYLLSKTSKKVGRLTSDKE